MINFEMIQYCIPYAERNKNISKDLIATVKSFKTLDDYLNSNDVKYSWIYHVARFILKGRWEALEPIILEHPFYTCLYARDVIKGRWDEAEENLLRSSCYMSFLYCIDVINERWDKLEKLLIEKRELDICIKYTDKIIKEPFEDFERIILESPEYSYRYARDIIKGPWKPFEDHHYNNIKWGFFYARDVIKKPWRKFEESLNNSWIESWRYFQLYKEQMII